MATYDYIDADGTLVYQVVRYAPKDFRQRRPDGKGGWIWNLAGVERILYRLPELLAADPDQPIFACEGEKDADNVAALGLVATTCSGGAGKWHLINDLRPLEGRQVVILPDNDPGGQGLRHAEEVATSLQGIAASVKRLELPGLPANGGDVSDWIDSGGTAGNLLELAADAPEWAAPRGPTESGDQSIPSSDWLENLLQSATDDPGVLLEPDTVIRLRALGVADRVRLRAEVSNRKIKVPLSWLDKEIWGTSSKADEETDPGTASRVARDRTVAGGGRRCRVTGEPQLPGESLHPPTLGSGRRNRPVDHPHLPSPPAGGKHVLESDLRNEEVRKESIAGDPG